MNTLVIVSHPNLEGSIANKTIIEHLKKTVPNSKIEVRHLEALYPDSEIDVESEQSALLKADLLIFQQLALEFVTKLKQFKKDSCRNRYLLTA